MSSRPRALRLAALLAAAGLLPCCQTDVGSGDQVSQVTAMVSQAQGDRKVNGFCSGVPAISGDGRFVAFDSDATDLVPGDINGKRDVFVKDRTDGSVEMVSIEDVGGQGDLDATVLDISADGNRVLFYSQATFSGYLNTNANLFVRDRAAGRTWRVTGNIDPDAAIFRGSISKNGRYVAFDTSAQNLGLGLAASSQVFVADLNVPNLNTSAPTLVLASRAAANGTTGSNNGSFDARMFGNGTGVVFASNSTTLLNAATGYQIYMAVPNFATPDSTTVALVSYTDSIGTVATGSCGRPSASDDGRFVAFETTALNMDPIRIAVRDITGNSTIAVYNEHYAGGFVLSSEPRISADGRFVAFHTGAALVAPASGQEDVYIGNVQGGGFERASVDSYGNTADSLSLYGSFSRDGRWIVFQSRASNLVVGDTNGFTDIFVRGPR